MEEMNKYVVNEDLNPFFNISSMKADINYSKQ